MTTIFSILSCFQKKVFDVEIPSNYPLICTYITASLQQDVCYYLHVSIYTCFI